ncbi:MAG: GDP-mannose 4,6-dehydratase [Deltaproteobacteria bacterium]|nr:GDP-mannose 4,6-dehydratase [Deltaproteobacteria bacterium]
MKTVAVIGSNSFSGSDLVDLLLTETESRVLGISRSPEKSALSLPYLKNPHRERFRFHQLDLNGDMEALLALLAAERPSWIVNFAAQSEVAPSWENPEQWFQTNAVALARLGNFLKDQPWLERYVHISSPEVYGTCVGTVREDAPLNPSTHYAASKAAADLFLTALRRHFGFPVVFVRSTNVYGAHQQLFKIIPRTVIYLRLGRKVSLHGGGHAVKSYIHIRDVSRGELAILRSGALGETYHLSPDGGVAVRDVVRGLCERLGRPFEESTETVAERLGQDAAYVIDSSKARETLGWRPAVGLSEGLSEVVTWIDEYWDEILTASLDYVHKP